MNVKELIEELQKHDPAAMVVIDGYEDGVNEVEATRIAGIDIDANPIGAWYYGRHKEDDSSPIKAVKIMSKSSRIPVESDPHPL